MANIQRVVLETMVADALTTIFTRTHVDNVVYSGSDGSEVLLSTILAQILAKTNALGALASKDTISDTDLAAALKTTLNNKADKGTTLTAYGIGDAYTKTQVDALVSAVLHFKGTKNYQSELPSTGNVGGDIWLVKYSGTTGTTAWNTEFLWSGTVWEMLGTTIDLSGYATAAALTSGLAGKLNTTGTAAKANQLATPRTIDGMAFDGSANVAHYGTTTGTNTYVVALTGFTLGAGAVCNVKFTAANTATAITLNVNGTGAKTVLEADGSAPPIGAIVANGVYGVVYDGTNYYLNTLYDVPGTAGMAAKLAVARTIALTGGATASGTFDGSANLSLSVTGLDVSKATAGILPLSRGGLGTADPATARLSLGAAKIYIGDATPAGFQAGDLFLRKV